jgi:ribosomal protein L18E
MTKNQEQQGFVEGVKILQDPNKKISDIPKQIVRSKTKSLKDTRRNRVKGNVYKIKSISVRWVSNSLGYSSPTTGSRLQKIWESLGLAKIERRSQVLCRAINIDKMNRYAKDCGYDLNNRYFITNDGYARERLINYIFINQENMEEIERRTEYKLKLMHG